MFMFKPALGVGYEKANILYLILNQILKDFSPLERLIKYIIGRL